MSPYHTIETPRGRAGAIALIRAVHDDPESIGLPNPAPGTLRLADLFGIDQGVAMRSGGSGVLLMPHGGPEIVRQLSARLESLGLPLLDGDDPELAYPEAESQIEAWMLSAIAHSASPDAVDLLIEHAARWEKLGIRTIEAAERIPSAAPNTLHRLIHPPIVAAVGRANVGKSSLINALAGEQIALVADIAGTTRDHVGVLVNLGGLVVRWVDTPGIDERITGGDEIKLATRVVGNADLIVHCIDAGEPDAGDRHNGLDPRLAGAMMTDTPVLRIGTRGDLGPHRAPVEARVSVAGDQSGIDSLVGLVREMLVPRRDLEGALPWRFWEPLGPVAGVDCGMDPCQ